MKITEILKKISEGKEISAEEKAFLASYAEPKADTAELDEIKAKLQQAEQEKAALQTKLDEADNGKLSEVEKLKKEITARDTQIANLTKERDTLKTQSATQSREYQLERIARENKCDRDFLEMKVTKAGLDLNKADKVTEFITQLKKDSPKFFEAEANPGGGGTPPNPEGGDTTATNQARIDELLKKDNLDSSELAEVIKLNGEINGNSDKK